MRPVADRQRPTVREIVRAVVLEWAPEEVPLLDIIDSEPDDGRVTRALAGRSRRRDPLGFGLDQVVPLITPIIWIVVDQAVRQATDAGTGGVRHHARRLLGRLRPRRGTRRSVRRTVPALSTAQLAGIRSQVRDQALKVGVEPSRAETIADSVVAQLILGRATQRPADGHEHGRGSTSQ
jgi:hypothetical protein